MPAECRPLLLGGDKNCVQMEQRTDVYLSTLENFVEARGAIRTVRRLSRRECKAGSRAGSIAPGPPFLSGGKHGNVLYTKSFRFLPGKR